MAVVAPATMIDYEKNIKEFFKEHLHEHEEIRLILGGGGGLLLVHLCILLSGCSSIEGGCRSTKNFFFVGIYDGLAGYEDIRDFDGRWIRIHVKKGDLIILPPGMYHRFTLDDHYYVKVSCCTRPS